MAEKSQLVQEFCTGNIQFSADLYRNLMKGQDGNFLVCPLSVQVVLALLQSGAKGATAQELSKGLRLPENSKKIQETFLEVLPRLRGTDQYELNSANKIYFKNDFKINDEYRNVAVKVFESEIQNIDFSKREEAANEINKWVEEKTQNTIKNIIQQSNLKEATRIILINTMFFHGKWVHTFPYYATAQSAFHLDCKNEIIVDMMKQMERFKFYENPELNTKFLEMKYEGDEISMNIVLPNDIEGLSALEGRLADLLIEPPYEDQLVEVKMPKFKIETGIMVKPILMKLGIQKAFASSADFSGIGANQGPLHIDEVIQKTFIEVHEKGTIAGAATVVSLRPFSKPPSEYETFIADHPFIYYLKSPVGIMFVGRYAGVEN